MEKKIFNLHEDDWGMIELSPRENLASANVVAKEASEFGAAHFTAHGWTAAYILPDISARHPLAARRITLEELQDLLADAFPPADEVLSGYSSFREVITNAFAFGTSDGAFYGNFNDGLVTRLNILISERKATLLSHFLYIVGQQYNLLLADWWHDAVIDLSDKEMIDAYFKAIYEE